MSINSYNGWEKMNRSIEVMRSSAKLLSSQIVVVTFSLFYFIIITRLLTKLELSSIAIFIIITTFCAMFTGLGLTASCLQKAPELLNKGEKVEACALIKISIFIPFILSLIIAIGAFFISPWISKIFFKTQGYANLVKVMILGIVTYKLQEILGHIFKVVQRFGKMAITKVINDVGGKILGLTLFFAFGIKGYIFGLIIGQGLAILFSIYYLRDYIFFKSRLYPIGRLVRYSLPYYSDGFVRFGTMQADQLIIGVFLRPELLATYYVVRRSFDYLQFYIDALLGPIVPKIAELKTQGKEIIQRAFTKTSRYLSFSLIPVSLLIAAISYPLLRIYGGDKYIGATPVLALLSLATIAYGLYSLYGINVYILGKPVERFKQESVSSLLNVLLGLGLVIPLNIFGLAVARLFSLSGAASFSRHLLKKLSKTKFDILAFRHTLVASLLMVTVIIIAQLLYYNIFIVPVYVLAGITVYLFFFCRVLNRDDIDLIRGFLPGRLLPLVKLIYFFGGKKLKF